MTLLTFILSSLYRLPWPFSNNSKRQYFIASELSPGLKKAGRSVSVGRQPIARYIMDLIEIGELVLFAKQHYRAFAEMSDQVISNYFITYQDTIIIDRRDKEIRGFALYQIWPDFWNFIIVCHLDEKKFGWLMKIVRSADKTVAWFDENKMKARFIKCRQ